jgi:tetratricopeptide (TPR) repeat protein
VTERQFNPFEILQLTRIDVLLDAAGSAYSDRRLSSAAAFYSQALQLSEQLQSQELIDDCHGWLGICFYQLGRLKDALATLGSILQTPAGLTNVEQRYSALIHYIETAQRLPIGLESIQAAYAQVESFLSDIGHTDWRHELLVMLVRLHVYRGKNEVALSTAQEAWSLRRLGRDGGYYGQVDDFHLDALVEICLKLRNPDAARSYLNQWELAADIMPVNREVRLSKSRSELARFEGQVADAINFGRRAVFIAETTDYQETKFAAFVTLIRAYLLGGQCENACEVIKRLLRMRHSESKHDQYTIHLILGDYYLAKVCEFLGIDYQQIQFQERYEAPIKSFRSVDGVSSALKRAESSYRRANRLGSRIDKMLQCNKREQEISARHQQVDFIRNYLWDSRLQKDTNTIGSRFK